MRFWGGLVGLTAALAVLLGTLGPAIGLVAVALLLAAAWWWPRCRASTETSLWRWPQLAALAAAGAWTAGVAQHLSHGAVEHTAVSAPLAAVAYLALCGWLATVLRLRCGARGLGAWLDAALVTVVLGALVLDVVLHPPDWAQASTPPPSRSLVLPVVLAVGLGLGVRVLLAGAARLASAWLLLGSLLAALVGSTLLVLDPASSAPGLIALGIAPLLLAGGLVHPSVMALARPQPGQRVVSESMARPVIIVVALAVPAVLFVRHSADEPTAWLPLIAAVVAVGIVPWRLVLAVRHHQHQLRQARAHTDRQAALAQISAAALAARAESDVLATLADTLGRVLAADVAARHQPCAPDPPGHQPDGQADGQAGEELLACVPVTDEVALEVRADPQRGAPPAPLSPAEHQLLTSAAGIGATAIRRLRAEADLHHRSLHDPLTGLPNRTLVRDRLAHALHAALRTSQPVGVIFLDLDDFKAINDQQGHAAGDRLLASIAAHLPGALRPGDTVGRVGGDESVIVCPEADQTALHGVAERAAHAIEQATREQTGSPLAVSAGTTTGHPGDDPDLVLAAADHAMYRAKPLPGSSLAARDHDTPEALEH